MRATISFFTGILLFILDGFNNITSSFSTNRNLRDGGEGPKKDPLYKIPHLGR